MQALEVRVLLNKRQLDSLRYGAERGDRRGTPWKASVGKIFLPLCRLSVQRQYAKPNQIKNARSFVDTGTHPRFFEGLTLHQSN